MLRHGTRVNLILRHPPHLPPRTSPALHRYITSSVSVQTPAKPNCATVPRATTLQPLRRVPTLASRTLATTSTPPDLASVIAAVKMSTPPQQPPSWKFTPAEVKKSAEDMAASFKKLDDQIGAIPVAEATYENTIVPQLELENATALPRNQLTFFQHVSADKELREASAEAEKILMDASVESTMRHDVFQRVETVHNQLDELKKTLDPEYIRAIEKMYKGYVRSGLGLPEETRKKVEALNKRKGELAIKFANNLSNDTSFIAFTAEELEGVPKDVTDGFEKTEEGKLKMTFQYPDLFPVLRSAKNADVRKRAFIGDQNRVKDLNTPLLKETVEIRTKLANLLGYRHHCDYVLEDRMAKKYENVMPFLEDLKERIKPQGQKDIAELLPIKKADYEAQGKSADYKDVLYVWETRYFLNKLLEDQFKIDQEKIAEYFPLQNVLDKSLAFFENLFSLKFVETPKNEASTWHEDVKQYAVWKYDTAEPVFVGWFYLDLHPRPNKYGHAANFGIGPGYTDLKDGSRTYPTTSLVCNFTKPTAEKPSLLKHSEVTTFFHELGHGIHDLMGTTKLSRFHGTSVSWDFVECPSQMLEFWTWEPEQIKHFSAHYKDGSKMSDETIKSLVDTKHVCDGLHYLRQVHFAMFDFGLHNKGIKDAPADLDKTWNDLREEIALVNNDGESMAGYSTFGHIMGGYDSGYYGYLWSEVFAADIYYTRFKDDPMSTKSGLDYRKAILDRGGSRDEIEGLKEVLGREPNNDAFLKELGIAA
ncbi:Saccharolysin [Yarrowia sp. B02]|nr:Saccharolysin [Yarrowia sp. B02]